MQFQKNEGPESGRAFYRTTLNVGSKEAAKRIRSIQVWIPQLFYTYFYNHAHRLRLEKLFYLELSRSSNGFLKPLLDPDGGFTFETAERPKNLTAIYLTDIPKRSQVPVRV
jgi:hypothetical protein